MNQSTTETQPAVVGRLPSVWSRQFAKSLALQMAFSTAFNGSVPLLPLYLVSFGSSDQEVGLVVGAYGLAALVLRPLSGWLTDQFGAKTVALLGAVLFALPTPLFALTTALPLLLLLRVVQSAGIICFFTASMTLGASAVHPLRMGMAMGFVGLAGSFGGLVASPFAVQISEWLGWFGTMSVLAGLAALACGLGLTLRPPPRPRAEPGHHYEVVSRRTVVPTLFFFSFTLTQGPILAFAPLFALERNLGNPGLFLAAVGLGNMAIRPAMGWAADRFGRAQVILPGLVLSGASMLLIATVQSQGWFLVWALLYGLANGMVFTALIALTIDRVAAEQRGSAIATFQWGWDIGSSVSAAVMGMLAAFVGYGGLFVIGAVPPLVGAAVFCWALSRRVLDMPRGGERGAWANRLRGLVETD